LPNFTVLTYAELLLDEIEVLKKRNTQLKGEFLRMHNCVLYSLLEATALMGMTDHKRKAFINAQMKKADDLRDKALSDV